MVCKKPTSQQGMSLVEVLVALALTGIVAIAVAPLVLLAVQVSSVSRDVTDLNAMISDRVEALRTLPFSDTDLPAGGSVGTSEAGFSEDPYRGDPDLYVRWEIVDESVSLKRVRVVAGRRDSALGPPREIMFETFRAALQ